MADKYWKAVERRIAKLFGTERIGAKNGNNQPDFVNEWLVGEVVCHDVPKWVRAEHQQAIDAAEGRYRLGDRLPVLVIHEKGEDEKTDLIVLRLTDFVDWFGSGQSIKNVFDRLSVAVGMSAPDDEMILQQVEYSLEQGRKK